MHLSRARVAALPCLVLLLAPAAAARAQDADGWRTLPAGQTLRAVPIADCPAAALTIVWPHPFRADAGEEKALANALAHRRSEQADAVLPAGARQSIEVGDGMTLFHLLLPRATPEAVAAFVRALASCVDPARDADAVALTLARAALAADDAEWLWPGDVLASRARKAIAAGEAGGTSTGGAPGFLQSCTPAAFAAAMAEGAGGPLRAVVVGDVAVAEALAAAIAAVPGQVRGGGRHAAAPAQEAPFGPHPRIDGPFVVAAVPAPRPSAQSLPFALLAEVLRARATLRFHDYRGGEFRANAPFLSYSFLAGDPVLLLFRRGPDFSDVARPRQELEELLQDARSRPVAAHELDAAVRLLQAEFAVPPWTAAQTAAWRANPAGLAPRARALALLGHWQIPDGAVRSLAPDPAGATAVLAAALAADRVWWGGLEPTVARPEAEPAPHGK